MEIRLDQVGKRFRFEWVFRNVNLVIPPKSSFAITGANGSGKSTLLKLLSGKEQPSKGSITYIEDTREIDPNNLFKKLSIAAPYLDLIEELTLREQLIFHSKHTGADEELLFQKVVEHAQFKQALDKEILFFSSGMKQRLKLILALNSQRELVLLDEPTSNLDKEGIAWYLREIKEHLGKSTILISSNILEEYDFCDTQIAISQFKS